MAYKKRNYFYPNKHHHQTAIRKILIAANIDCKYEPSPDLLEYSFLKWLVNGLTIRISPISWKSAYILTTRHKNGVPIDTDNIVSYETLEELIISLKDMNALRMIETYVSRPKHDPLKLPSDAVQVLIDKHFKNK